MSSISVGPRLLFRTSKAVSPLDSPRDRFRVDARRRWTPQVNRFKSTLIFAMSTNARQIALRNLSPKGMRARIFFIEALL